MNLSSRRSGAGDAAFLVGSQVLASLLLFATGVFVARALGPRGKGFYDIVVGSATLLATVTGLAMPSGVFFRVSRGGVDIRRLMAVSVLVAVAAGALSVSVLWFGGSYRWIGWMLPDSDPRRAAVLIGVVLLALQAQQLIQAAAKGRGCFRAFAASELLAKGGLAAAAAILLAVGAKAPPAYLAALAASTAVAVIFLIGAAGAGPATGGELPLAAMFWYSLPLFLGNIVQFLNYRLDIFLVKNFLGLGAVGTYTVAVWLAQTIWLAPTQLGSLVLRTVAEQGDSAAVLTYVARVNRFCLALSVCLAVVLAVVGTFGITRIFGRGFQGSVVPLLLLLPGVVLFSSTIIFSAYLNGIERQAYTTWVACGSLVITVGANLLLVPRIGVPGAAITSTLSYGASTVATLLIVRRLAPEFTLADFLVPRRSDIAAVVLGLRGAVARLRVPASAAAEP